METAEPVREAKVDLSGRWRLSVPVLWNFAQPHMLRIWTWKLNAKAVCRASYNDVYPDFYLWQVQEKKPLLYFKIKGESGEVKTKDVTLQGKSL